MYQMNGIVLFSRKNFMSNLTQMFKYDVSKRTKIHRRYNLFGELKICIDLCGLA